MSVYAGNTVPHEVSPKDSLLAVKLFAAVRHVCDVGISVKNTHLAGSAILGNFSQVGLSLGNR